MNGEGSLWGLLLFVLLVGAFAAWKTGAVQWLRTKINKQ